jgi:hypothetical protein
MRVAGSPINSPRVVQLDQRDWDSIRDRLLRLEEENRRLANDLALFQQGMKERLDVFSLLLSGFEARLVGKDMG